MPIIPPSTKYFLREMSISTKFFQCEMSVSTKFFLYEMSVSTKSFLCEVSVSTKSFINIRYAVHNRKAAFRSAKDGLLQDER